MIFHFSDYIVTFKSSWNATDFLYLLMDNNYLWADLIGWFRLRVHCFNRFADFVDGSKAVCWSWEALICFTNHLPSPQWNIFNANLKDLVDIATCCTGILQKSIPRFELTFDIWVWTPSKQNQTSKRSYVSKKNKYHWTLPVLKTPTTKNVNRKAV